MSTTSAPSRSRGISAAAPPAHSPGSKGSGRSFGVIAWTVLIIFSVIWLIPSFWAIKTSLTSNSTAALGAIPIVKDWHLTTASYQTLLKGGDIWQWYLASAVTGVVTVFLSMLVCTMAGYALSRMRFKGSTLMMGLIVLGVMIPGQVLIVPLFALLNQLGILGTYWSVILPQVPQVIAVFVFKHFFDSLPKDFEEAARIDGAGYWQTYTRILLPLSRPVIAAMSIVTFVGVWNNLLLPLFVLTNPKLMTIPVGLATVQGSFGQRYADIQASSILGALPLIVLFLIFQRQVVEGVAGSGIKG
jgi:multiple sugar transport system permease protein